MNTIKQSGAVLALAGIAAFVVALTAAAPAAAQTISEDIKSDPDTAPMTERRRSGFMEEIVVTTRKVEENIQDVPLSITAFDSGLIEAAGITNLQDVADLTPGLSFFNAFGENLPVPIIRGIAQTDIFGEPNAAIFVDGVYVAGREGLNFSQLDIERIEVVKGPQSALYGRTAFSGAINYVTKRPAEEYESRIDAELGNRGKQRISGLISGPIFWEQLRGRIAALYDDFDGSYDNSEYPDNEIGGRKFRSFQGSLVWFPTDNFEVYGSVYSSNDEIDDAAIYAVSANCENRIDDTPNDIRYNNYCGEVPTLTEAPSPGPGVVSQDSIPKIAEALGEDRDLTRAQLNITWDVSFGTFTALTGYTKTEQNSTSDFGHIGGYLPYLYCSGAAQEAPGSPNSCGQNPANQMFFSGVLDLENGGNVEEISQEIRFSSNQDQRFRYTVGAYFYTSESEFYDGGIINVDPLPADDIGLPPFDPSAPNFAIGTAIFYCGFTDDGCLDPLVRPFGGTDNDSWAVFTGMDFDLTDRLTVRGEIRYGEQKESVWDPAYATCTPTGDVANCGDDWYDLTQPDPIPFDPNDLSNSTRTGSTTFDSVTGRLGLDYRINDAWMVYASWALGNKPGGLQLAAPLVIDPTVPGGQEREALTHTFDTEVLNAYEVGLKGRTEDGTFGLDVAVFYNDWKDIVLRQIVENSPGSGRPLQQPTAFNFNAGTAKVWGFEMTTDLLFTDNFSGRFTVNWNNSTLTNAQQDTFETWPTFYPTGDVSGNKLLRQPEWMGSASLDYMRPVFGNWDGFARIDASWQDQIFLGNDNQSWLAPRWTSNLRLGLESDRFSLAFWVRNLFNNDEPVAGFRDIYWTNTDSITPPFQDLGPRPSFDKFVPLRYTLSYPNLRTYGITATVRFGAAAQ